MPRRRSSESSELESLRAEVERLRRATAPKPLTFRVGQKGGVAVYGLGRFPVTLYIEQWDRLLAEIDSLHAFLEKNRPYLRVKGGGGGWDE